MTTRARGSTPSCLVLWKGSPRIARPRASFFPSDAWVSTTPNSGPGVASNKAATTATPFIQIDNASLQTVIQSTVEASVADMSQTMGSHSNDLTLDQPSAPYSNDFTLGQPSAPYSNDLTLDQDLCPADDIAVQEESTRRQCRESDRRDQDDSVCSRSSSSRNRSSRSSSPHSRHASSWRSSRNSRPLHSMSRSSPSATSSLSWIAVASSDQPASWMLSRTRKKIPSGDYVDFDTILTDIQTNTAATSPRRPAG